MQTTGSRNSDTEDEWEIHPIITYRHLLSNVPNVYNPLRVVALCDNDAFYATCERIRLGLPPETPVAALQWDSLIAVSYPARKYGVKRMDNIKEARKKCPDLVAVHVMTYKEGDSEPAYHDNPDPRRHKVSLDHYRRESKRIVDVYREMLPKGADLEKASIDECFFCLTLPVRDILVQRYPHLGQVPPDAPQGLDTPLPPPPLTWPFEGLGNMIPMIPSSPYSSVRKPQNSITKPSRSPRKDQPELPECNSQQADVPVTWHDIALAIGAEIMLKIRSAVKERLGYTTSCGIARNKPLAKLIASYKKLDQQTILRTAAIPGYWRPMPFQSIRFLGGKLGRTLSDDLDAKTVGDLEHITLSEMQRMYGEESIWVWQVLRGIDRSEVTERTITKSMLASKNIRPSFTDPDEGEQWIRLLASELAVRLADAREVTHGIWPKTIAVHFVQDSEPRMSRQSAFPYTRNLTATYVGNVALKLWNALTDNKKEKSASAKIHNIGISFGGLSVGEAGQKGIEGFLVTPRRHRSRSPLDHPLRSVPDEVETSKKRSRNQVTSGLCEDIDPSDGSSFVCSRCSKRISLPPRSERYDDDHSPADAIALLKMEHEDFHFAQDLAREGNDPNPSSGSKSTNNSSDEPSSKKPRKKTNQDRGRKANNEGIAKYFSSGVSPSSLKK